MLQAKILYLIRVCICKHLFEICNALPQPSKCQKALEDPSIAENIIISLTVLTVYAFLKAFDGFFVPV